MIRFFYLFILLLLFNLPSQSLLAQLRSISGKVISETEVLPFVSIVIKGTSVGTTSDAGGEFKLDKVQNGDVLVFSYIGYQNKEISIKDQSYLLVELKAEAEDIEEVVVTALGIVRQERKLGYSTEKVDAEIIEKSSTPNIITAMTGRAAGVQIANSDGVDGGSIRVTIRGNNNITENNQPLIVIDGVMMDNNQKIYGGESSYSQVGRGQDWGSALNNIQASDIESYNILKGGAASALYGSRGANGVIEITTKKGKAQKGIGVNYDYSLKITNPYRYREVQNKYGAGGPISFTPPTFPIDNDGTELYPGVYGTDQLIINQQGNTSNTSDEFGYYGSAVSWGPEMDGRLIRWWDGTMRNYSPQPDNQEIFYRNSITNTHHISASGGNEKGTLRLSISQNDHTPIILNSNYTQTTINLGSNIQISSKIKAVVSASYINYKRLNSPILGEDANSFAKGILYSWPRSYQGIDFQNYANIDGTRNELIGYPFLYVNQYLWWEFFNHNQQLNRDKFISSISLNYQINDWLNFSTRAGMDFNLDQLVKQHQPINLLGLDSGYYSNSFYRDESSNFDVLFTTKKFETAGKKIGIELSAGGARWDKKYYGIQGNSGKWYYPNMYTLTNHTPYQIVNGSVIQTGNYYTLKESILARRTNSVYAYANIDYSNYLFLQLTGRNDWSSTLPANSNSYFYPSASLSLVLSELFDLHAAKINFAKLRLGIAQTASDADPYQTNFYYQTVLFGGNQSSGLPNAIPPIALKPQRVNSYEGGLNMAWFENRIELDFTYYYFYSFDQIIKAPVPYSSGAPLVSINEGILANQGIELIINTVPIQTEQLIFKSGLNFTRNRNKVISLGDYADEYLMADIWGLNGPAMILRVGDDFGTISGYDYVYHENGQPILNDEGTQYLITDTRVPIGNASPDFIAGWTTDLSYKNISISTLIDTKWGGDIYAGSYVIGLQSGQSPETLLEREGGGLPYTDPAGNTSNIGVVLPGVYANGEVNDKVVHYYYKYLPNAGGWGHYLSTPGVVENSWIKFREISISYRFSDKILKKLSLFQGLTASIVGRDLFYIYSSLPDRINPEGLSGSGNAQGFEWAAYPGTRSFIVKIQASF